MAASRFGSGSAGVVIAVLPVPGQLVLNGLPAGRICPPHALVKLIEAII
jgi:hypothetical protein